MKATASAPFCHCFDVDDRHYAYDAHTNGLLEIDPALAAVLPLYGRMARRDIAAQLAPTFDTSTVRRAFAAIEHGRRDRGLFLARRPRPVPPPVAMSAPGACDRDLQHLVLTVTERCNLRCRYCVHGADLGWIRAHGAANMSPEVALQAARYFLDRADPATEPVISFYGGEALLEPDLIAAVVAAARAHPRGAAVTFAIDSNGVLLDDRIIDLAVRERMYLQLSLDGPAVEHDRHRVDAAGAPTHARIEAGLDRLLARDPDAACRLTFMVTLAPPVDLSAVSRYFADFPSFRRHGLTRSPRLRVSHADLRGLDWPATPVQVQALRQAVADEESCYLAAMAAGCRQDAGPVAAALCEPALIRWHHRGRAPLGRAWTPGGNCRPGRRKLHVMPDGSFHPCERTGNVMPIGDVKAGIVPARVGCLQREFHDALADRCRGCWALRLCGLCFAAQASSSDRAGAGAPPHALCEALRRSQERTLKIVARSLALPAERRAWLEATKVS
jgi:uncharacterized protein